MSVWAVEHGSSEQVVERKGLEGRMATWRERIEGVGTGEGWNIF